MGELAIHINYRFGYPHSEFPMYRIPKFHHLIEMLAQGKDKCTQIIMGKEKHGID